MFSQSSHSAEVPTQCLAIPGGFREVAMFSLVSLLIDDWQFSFLNGKIPLIYKNNILYIFLSEKMYKAKMVLI